MVVQTLFPDHVLFSESQGHIVLKCFKQGLEFPIGFETPIQRNIC